MQSVVNGFTRLLFRCMSRLFAASLLLGIVLPVQAQLIISEFRLRGPSGANDEYIVIENNSGADHTVAGGGAGYGGAASDGVTRFTIPNGGSYLGVNSVAYSLASYPAGNGTTATGDATWTTDIPDNAGIALFNNNSGGASYTLANRLDAVGSTAEADALYKEGTGYPALVPFSIDSAFTRDRCGKGGSITTMGLCPSAGAVLDTGNNAVDFIFVDTNGTSAGAGQRLGAPSPRNLSSPTVRVGASFGTALLDTCVVAGALPNKVRDFTGDPPNNSTFGTLDLRRTFTNNSGGNITRLRFRVIDLTTFPAPSGIADLRPRTSTNIPVTVDRAPCGSGTSNVTVNGTVLEQPPSQPNGGGFNSTLSANTVTLGTPLANGASIDLRFLFGIQQTGVYKVRILIEALPGAGGAVVDFEGHTDSQKPAVTINQAALQADPTAASPINFTAVFDREVTGFTGTDVQLSGTANATTAVVTGGPITYNVAVSGMTINGTVVASIPASGAVDLEGAANVISTSADNTVTFTGDVTAPTVTIDQAFAQVDPTATSPINFTVEFNEDVSGFTDTDVQLSGTALATTAVVTGGPRIFNVAVSGMTTNGTVIASIPAGAALDLANNPSLASTSTDSTVTFNGADLTPPSVTINLAAAQTSPTSASPINFTVVFSEEVTGFTAADVQLSGTGGATTAVVTGGPVSFNVAVSGMTTSGTVLASIPAGAALDLASNPSLVSTSTNNSVAWVAMPVVPVPALSEWALAMLALLIMLFAGTGYRRMERRSGSR